MPRRNREAPEMSFEELMAGLANRVPGARIQQANEVHNPYLIRRPTGILSLDLGIGGGAPAGGVVEFWGPPNSGKNMLCNCLIRQNQRIHGANSKVGLACVEYDFDKLFAISCGVKVSMSPSELYGLGLEGEAAEPFQQQIGEVGILDAPTAEELLETICEAVAWDRFQIIILDSVAALLVKEEEESPLFKPGMTGTALPRTMSKWLRKLNAAQKTQPHGRPNLTTLVTINQITAKIGGFTRPGMPPPVQEKGGHALRHGKLLSVELKRGKSIKSGQVEIGHEVRWKVSKGKAGCAAGAVGEFQFYSGVEGFVTGPNYRDDALRVATSAGLISRRGSSYEVNIPEWDISPSRGRESLLRKLDEFDPDWPFLLLPHVLEVNEIHAYQKWEDAP